MDKSININKTKSKKSLAAMILFLFSSISFFIYLIMFLQDGPINYVDLLRKSILFIALILFAQASLFIRISKQSEQIKSTIIVSTDLAIVYYAVNFVISVADLTPNTDIFILIIIYLVPLLALLLLLIMVSIDFKIKTPIIILLSVNILDSILGMIIDITNRSYIMYSSISSLVFWVAVIILIVDLTKKIKKKPKKSKNKKNNLYPELQQNI